MTEMVDIVLDGRSSNLETIFTGSAVFMLTLANRTLQLREMSMALKAHDDVELTSLKPVLALQNIIHHLAILARISAVDQVYDASGSRQVRGSDED
jgi:hypothetical protein